MNSSLILCPPSRWVSLFEYVGWECFLLEKRWIVLCFEKNEYSTRKMSESLINCLPGFIVPWKKTIQFKKKIRSKIHPLVSLLLIGCDLMKMGMKMVLLIQLNDSAIDWSSRPFFSPSLFFFPQLSSPKLFFSLSLSSVLSFFLSLLHLEKNLSPLRRKENLERHHFSL